MLLTKLTPLLRVLGVHMKEKYFLDFRGVFRRQRVQTVFGEIPASKSRHFFSPWIFANALGSAIATLSMSPRVGAVKARYPDDQKT